MRHVIKIKEMLDNGERDEAKNALETLLALGPGNMEALKLKARIFANEGRFNDEEKVWIRILEIDREDEDAIHYILRRQIEDREHYYFTDHVAGGGRRFLAYPRALVKISLMGLIGCISFLTLTRLSAQYPLLAQPAVILGAFCAMVMSPWVAIIYTYLRSLRTVTVSRQGVELTTRLKSFRFQWNELKQVILAHSTNHDEPHLQLVLVPVDTSHRTITVDLNEDSTSIRARTHLVQELINYCPQLALESDTQLTAALARSRRY